MASKVTFAKTSDRLIALASNPAARGLLLESKKEDVPFSGLQLLELENLHQVGHVPVDLGVYKKGDTVPLWVAPIEDHTFPSVAPAPSTTSPLVSQAVHGLVSQAVHGLVSLVKLP